MRVSRHRVQALRWTALGVLVTAVAVQAVRVLHRPPLLSVTTVRVETVTRMLAVTGSVEAARSVSLSPRVAGRLTEIAHYEGERVHEGDVLARLEDVAATALVREQRASLRSEQAALAQARRDLARSHELVTRGARAAADLEPARLAVARNNEQLRSLEAALREATSQLTLRAPFDGTIVRRFGELGGVVGPDTAVFTLASVDDTRVSAEVDERYVRALRLGMAAAILPVGPTGTQTPATISYVAQAVDAQTGAATVRFAYDRVPASGLVGMSVDINVLVETLESALTVPREAVGGVGTGTFVLLVRDGLVARREVIADDWPAEALVVSSGLAAGDVIALDPRAAVVGAHVRAQLAAP